MKLAMQIFLKSETYDESVFAWFLGGQVQCTYNNVIISIGVYVNFNMTEKIKCFSIKKKMEHKTLNYCMN